LAKIKFSHPSKARDGWIQKKFWSILIYGMSKSEFVCENWTNFKFGLRIRGQNRNNVHKSGHNG
jgi:hypothetical protein